MHGILRSLFLGYFITHIPITILIDLQGAFPEYYPKPIRNVVLWYVETFGDFLMESGPMWFRSFLYCKLYYFTFFFCSLIDIIIILYIHNRRASIAAAIFLLCHPRNFDQIKFNQDSVCCIRNTCEHNCLPYSNGVCFF